MTEAPSSNHLSDSPEKTESSTRAYGRSVGLLTIGVGLTGIFTEFAEDAFHPNDRGYEIWADTFWPLVQNRVEESVARIAE